MSKHIAGVLSAALLVAACQQQARADEFVIDNVHSSVVFRVGHMGYGVIYGRFNKLSGGYSLEPGKPEATTFQIAIEAASVDTNDAKRDEHLRTADFLSAGEFPAITFKSVKSVPRQTDAGIALAVTGDLTLHGVTRPVTLELTKLGEGPGPTGQDFRTGFSCQTKLKRSDYGMTKMAGLVGDEIEIMIGFEGVRKDKGAPTTGARPAGAKTLRR
jgi:polyisoprenoid-binding protein YceI